MLSAFYEQIYTVDRVQLVCQFYLCLGWAYFWILKLFPLLFGSDR